jgi:uncharacterized protein DUF6158
MTRRPHGVEPTELSDDDLRRELRHLYQNRYDTLLDGSDSAFDAHTERMLALEREVLRRFPAATESDPLRTRAGRRLEAGQPVPGHEDSVE